MKKKTKIIFILVLAIFFTMLPTFGGVEVLKKSDLYVVSCGWPSNFIVQDQSWRDPLYPSKVACPNSPLENPTKFYWDRFIFNIAFFYLFISVLHYCWKYDHKRNAKEE